MAVPSTFADLSTTPGSNSGLISDSTAVNQIDNHLQSVYALIASIYANSGNGWSSTYLPSANPSYTGVLSGALGSVTNPAYTFTGDTNTGLFSPAADTLAATTGGAERMRIDSSGNVGIGTSGPGAKLEVSGAGNAAEVRIRSTDTTPANVRAYVNAVEIGKLSFLTGNVMLMETGGTERMRIDGSGNLLLGTTGTDSTNKLQVAGRIGATGFENTNGAYPAFSASILQGYPTYGFALNLNVENAGVNSYGVGILTTAAGVQAERMRIDSAGNVGIGATANASALLDVQSTTKGFRLPNMTTTQKNAISSPAAGLMVFDTTLSKACLYTGAVWQTITST